ncbi:hypothetical protein Tco_1047364 [Tanacetum coccineum]
MGTIDSMRSVLTQSDLDSLCEKYYIPDAVHPELPGLNSRIRNSPTDILAYFQINLSQLSIIAAAKVSHFKILCRVHGFEPTVGNFRRFYINSKNKGWMYFSKRLENAQEREVREGEVPFLELTQGCVVPFAGVINQVDRDNAAQDEVAEEAGDPNKGGDDAAVADHTEQGGPIVQVGGIDIVADEETQAIVANKPKVQKRRRKAGDASGSNHPPKKLMTDHGTFGDVGASTGGKSLAAIQELFKQSTLNVEVGVSAAATIPFMTSSVTPTPKREDGGRMDYVTGANLRTQLVGARFVVLFYSSHHSGTHAAGDEVISVVRSSVLDPAVLTTTIATTVVAGTFVPLPREVNEPAHANYETLHQTYFLKWDVLNEYVLDDPNVCSSVVDQLAPPVFFSQLRAMEYDQLFTEFNVGAAFRHALARR